MKRRNALLGLGTIVFGGAAVGTGAFSTTDQDRTVTVETTGDAASFLALEPAGEWAEEFVSETDGRIEIDITGTKEDDEDDGFSGVNEDGNTTLIELLQLTNQGTVDIQGIGADIIGESGEDELLTAVGDFEEISSETPLSPTDTTTFGLDIELRMEEIDDGVAAYDDDGGLTDSFDPSIDIIATTD